MVVATELDPHLNQVLLAHRVHVSQPKDSMVQLNAVPVGPKFSKPYTNVLLNQRSEQGTWQIFVDEDLSYTGGDSNRSRVFCGQRFRRWLVLVPPGPVEGDVNDAIRCALGWLDSPAGPVASPVAGQSPAGAELGLDPVLKRVGRLLAPKELELTGFEPTAAQADAIVRAAEAVTRAAAPNCPLLLGPTGCGKTAVARAAARELVGRGVVERVLEVSGASVCSGAIFWPERDERLRQTLEAVLDSGKTLVLLEQFDLALTKSETAPPLLADALDRAVKLIGVARAEFPLRVMGNWTTLGRRLEVLHVPEPQADELVRIFRTRLAQHPLAAKLKVATEAQTAVLAHSHRRAGGNPGAMLGLLEAVLNHASWTGLECVGPDDVFHLVAEPEE